MLTEICQYLHNWFNRKPNGELCPQYAGSIVILNNVITFADRDFALANGQYYRIMGSLFNDGVHKYGSDELNDEEFIGAVWSMAVPPAVVSLAEEIALWQAEYGAVGSAAMSPYNSESFGGYSYSKSAGAAGALSSGTWQSTYSARLAPWRKI